MKMPISMAGPQMSSIPLADLESGHRQLPPNREPIGGTDGAGPCSSSWDRERGPWETAFTHFPRFILVGITALILPATLLALFFGSIAVLLKSKPLVQAVAGMMFTWLAVLETYFSTAFLLAYRKHGGSPNRRKTAFTAWAVFTGVCFFVGIGGMFVVAVGWVGR